MQCKLDFEIGVRDGNAHFDNGVSDCSVFSLIIFGELSSRLRCRVFTRRGFESKH